MYETNVLKKDTVLDFGISFNRSFEFFIDFNSKAMKENKISYKLDINFNMMLNSRVLADSGSGRPGFREIRAPGIFKKVYETR